MKLSRIIVAAGLCLSASQVALANASGSEFEIFNPSGRSDNFTVHSTRMLEAGQFNLGLFLDLVMNSMPKVVEESEVCCDKREGYSDFLVVNHVVFALGITDDWDVGFSMPIILAQNDDEPKKVDLNVKGLTDIKFHSKVRLSGDDWNGWAFVFNAGKNLIEDNPFEGDGHGLTYSGEIVYAKGLSDNVDFAANIGYRWRDVGDNISSADFPVEPIKDYFLWSFVTSVATTDEWRWIAEVYGARPLSDYSYDIDRDPSPVEFLLGSEYNRTGSPYIFYMGAGTELPHAVGTADLRLFAGINWQGRFWDKKERKVKYVGPTDGELYEPKSTPLTVPLEKKAKVAPPKPEEPIKPVVDETKYESITTNSILFKPGSASDVDKSSIEELGRIAKHLQSRPYKKIVVAGHTDSTGSKALNADLSKRRAETIKGFLVKKFGLNEATVESAGFGDSQPMADNKTEDGRRKNRRVEFRIYYD